MAEDSLADRSGASAMDIQCHACRAWVPAYDAVHFGSIETGYRDLCSRCYNEEVARNFQIDFEHVAFAPTEMSDADGAMHRFHFLLRHLGDRVSLESFEIEQGERAGHQFQIVDAADADLLEIMRRLVERMRRALAKRYIVDRDGDLSIAGMNVCGKVDCDLDASPSMPILIVDGREVGWDQFGRMLMTFEGWQFNLTFHDPSEDV